MAFKWHRKLKQIKCRRVVEAHTGKGKGYGIEGRVEGGKSGEGEDAGGHREGEEAKGKWKERGGGDRRVRGIKQLMRENEVLRGLQEKIDVVHVPEGEVDILLMKRYYGDHIRAHPNNLEGMKKAVRAQYYHPVSSDEDPQHQHLQAGGED